MPSLTKLNKKDSKEGVKGKFVFIKVMKVMRECNCGFCHS